MMSNNRLNSTNRYVALDVETTGLSPKNGDRVIEIGAVAIENHSIIAEPQKRAHSPWLAAGLASESENSKLPYGRRFRTACCGELQFSSLIDVDKMIPWQVQQVHGITNEMLGGKAKPEEVWSEFYEFIAGSILVAHNASFDISFLRHEFALLGMGLNNRSLCTLKMSRKLYPHLPNHKLETVSRYLLGKSCKQMQRHRALDDAKLAGMIWLEMGKI